MAVSLLTSYTVKTREALSKSMTDASMAATKMSTGVAFLHAYEDPTGLAIGSNMTKDLQTLGVVFTGIKQTQSMMYIAEEGLKSIYNTLGKMNDILAKAKLGYMNDELVNNTLSPTYVQLKQEINRIADSIQFNGQNLLNGTGGVQHAAVQSTVSGTPEYAFSMSSNATLGTLATVAGVKANINGATTSSALTINTTGALVTISGGTISQLSDGSFKVGNCTLTITDLNVTDASSNSCVADLTLTDIDIALASTATFVDGVLTDSAASTITLGSSAYGSFTITDNGGGITSLSAVDLSTPATVTTTDKVQIDNVIQQFALTGGQTATSTFKFVTGTDLNGSIVTVEFPNLRLTDANNVTGIVSTLNTRQNINSVVPTDLTNLTSVKDADKDIPLLNALMDKLVVELDRIGAYQARFMNIEAQLSTSMEQQDLAAGAVMYADLANETEKFTRDSVKVNVAIAVLKQLSDSLEALGRLVQ